MNSILNEMKKIRKQLGLTQFELAKQSGVSLPTIQNIEAGKANPTLFVVEQLCSILGIGLQIFSREPDWNLLRACGAPLDGIVDGSIRVNAKMLVLEINEACLYFQYHPQHHINGTREFETIQALLLAIYLDYPTFYKKYLNTDLFNQYLPKNISGRMIKLRRIALSQIARYL